MKPSSLTSLVILLVALSNGYGQTPPVRFDRVSMEQGLSAVYSTCLLQDRQGFVWVGTTTGLNRLEGASVRQFICIPGEINTLSNNMVNCLLEDKRGTIWIGTNFGLNRYNPTDNTFSRFWPARVDVASSDNAVAQLYEDRFGTLWVITKGELYTFDRQKQGFTLLTLPGTPKGVMSTFSHRIWAFLEDKQGEIWVGTMAGLYRLNQQRRQFSKFSAGSDRNGPPERNIRSLAEDQHGSLWVATYGQGLYQLTAKGRGGWRVFRHQKNKSGSLPNDTVTTLHIDRHGTLWVGTLLNGLSEFNAATQQFTPYRPLPADKSNTRNSIFSITEDRRGVFWLHNNWPWHSTANANLRSFDPVSKAFRLYGEDPTDTDQLARDMIFDALEDKSGILWFASFGGGVAKLNLTKQSFRTISHRTGDSNSPPNKAVFGMIGDLKGNIWLATGGGGLVRYNPADKLFQTYLHDPLKPESPIYSGGMSACLDAKGTVWFSVAEWLDAYNHQTNSFTHHLLIPDGPKHINARTAEVIADKNGLLWAGTSHMGLYTYNPNSRQSKVFLADSTDSTAIAGNFIRGLAIDKSGFVWVGCMENGLSRLDPKTGKAVSFRADPFNLRSLSSNRIWTIHVDKQDRVWIGTRDGLNLFDRRTNTFTQFHQKDGLPHEEVLKILEDRHGNLWLSTPMHISKFDPVKRKFYTFDASDGTGTIPFFDRSGCVAPNGQMYFGKFSGFTTFHPDSIRTNTFVPPVVLTAFKKGEQVTYFDKPLSELKEIVLPHEENNISFEYAALNYSQPHKNQYAYQLVNFENDWVQAGTRRTASYTNLDPGEYVFRVKGSNNDGVWNEQGTSLRVVILPPWWQTGWFRLLASVAALGLLYSVYRYRIGQIRREQQLRDQISRDLHDDVGGILSGISFYSEAARQMHQQGRYSDSYALLQKIADNARTTIAHMSDVVWSMRSDTDNALKLAQRLESFGRELLSPLGIELVCQTDSNLASLKLAPDTIRNLYLVGKEALHNAAKYAQATEVHLNVSQQGGKVQIFVKDNGQGFDSTMAPSGNGLESMRKRAEAIGAVYTLSTQPGRGTVISVYFA